MGCRRTTLSGNLLGLLLELDCIHAGGEIRVVPSVVPDVFNRLLQVGGNAYRFISSKRSGTCGGIN